ncbi:MAG: hypothetical protein EB103_06910, partial [Actinobacteria bacterium]|nr:hypothetical protein [Actinomycetota bacterium]
LSERRKYVMESINAGTAVHGVVAGDSGTGGLTLTTPDGRNLSVWYDSTSVQGSDFGLGLDTTPPSNPMGVTGIAGAAASSFGSPKTTAIDFPALTAGKKFTVNGLTFTAGAAGTTAAQTAAAFANLKSGMTAVAVAAANSTSAGLGSFSGTFAEGFTTGAVTNTSVVTATATSKGNVADVAINPNVPTYVKTEGSGSATEKYDITFKSLLAGESVEINGLKFTATYNLSSTQVATAFASIAGNTDASTVTTNKATTSSLLGTFTGTFATGWSTGAITGSTVTATSATANTDVTDIAITGNPQSATAPVISSVTPVAASTVYGTVSLNSNSTFTVKPGANAYAAGSVPAADPTYANFTALGFQAVTINPKNIGRLNFQVGPAANQLISIDLADFGKNGDITGPITSDRAPT